MENPISKLQRLEEMETAITGPYYYSATAKDASEQSAQALSAFRGIPQSTASYRSFIDVEPNINVRTEFGRQHYDSFRPGEAVPEHQKQGIQLCMAAYDKIGIIKNIIDTMGDFACKGIKICHPNRTVQAWARQWFLDCHGQERSERFLNLLYRAGNVPVLKKTYKLTTKDIKRMRKAVGAADIKELPQKDIPRKEVPHQFIFLNPLTIEIRGGELAKFVGIKEYAIRLPSGLKREISKKENSSLVEQLPHEWVSFLNTNKSNLWPLPKDKISVFHYKKDDWQIWANPILYAILDDLRLLEKMKLADLAALDGAISSIRLWKLGSVEKNVMPSRAAALKLSDILTTNTGGGPKDIIWNDCIELQESNTQVYRFLGQEKYGPVLSSIYISMGIPGAMTGSAASSGFTNNALSLKTLTERLEYGRDTLKTFWLEQLADVSEAMRDVPGFNIPFEIKFDHMVLSDEASEKALLIQLADRNLISTETLHERFGESFHLEKSRLKHEQRDRASGKLPPQAGQWFNAEKEFDYKKILLQAGIVTPSELGIELEERKPGEKPMADKQLLVQKMAKTALPTKKPKGMPGQGRPKTSKDSSKRKRKRVLPRTKGAMELQVWLTDTQKQLNERVAEVYLKSLSKKNLRQLSVPEMYELEKIKFAHLMNTKAFCSIPENIDINNLPQLPNSSSVYYNRYLQENPNATVDNIRAIQLALYNQEWWERDYHGES